MLHTACFSRGFKKNVIYATDTDVVNIAIVIYRACLKTVKNRLAFGHGPASNRIRQ